MKFSYYWVIVLSIFGFIAMLISFLLFGLSGYKFIEPLIFFFPWGMIGALMDWDLGPLHTFMGFIQYPVYGIIIGFRPRIKHFRMVLSLMVLLHLVLAIILMIFFRMS